MNWPPELVSRQRLSFFRAALICLSYPGKLWRRFVSKAPPHSYSFQSWAGARGAKDKDRLGGQPDADRAIRFEALAKEQLALGTDDGLHGIPLVEGFSVSDFQPFSFWKLSSRQVTLLRLPVISRVLCF